MHLKRQEAPSNWPIHRKGTTYIAVPSGSKYDSIPLLIIIRDMLHLAKTRKEVESALRSGKILLNGKMIREDRACAGLFDIISISDKRYIIGLNRNGKFNIEETKKKKLTKILRITGKNILKKNRSQLHFNDGRNIISDGKYNTGEFVLFDMEKNKITANIPLKKGLDAIIISGRHSGKIGKIESANGKEVCIIAEDSKLNIPLAHISLINNE